MKHIPMIWYSILYTIRPECLVGGRLKDRSQWFKTMGCHYGTLDVLLVVLGKWIIYITPIQVGCLRPVNR